MVQCANNTKGRSWCLTLNNYTDEEVNSLTHMISKNKIKKFLLGKEIGKENNTPHIQGYIQFETQREFSTLKKWNPRIHWSKARANEWVNKKYCSKENNVFASKGFGLIDNKEHIDIWLKHLRHKGRENLEFKSVIKRLDLLERLCDKSDYKEFEYYTDKFDEMKDCKYCLDELKDW